MRHWTLLGEAPIPDTEQSLSLFQGKDVASILQDVVGGTRLGRTIEGMLPEKDGSAEK